MGGILLMMGMAIVVPLLQEGRAEMVPALRIPVLLPLTTTAPAETDVQDLHPAEEETILPHEVQEAVTNKQLR